MNIAPALRSLRLNKNIMKKINTFWNWFQDNNQSIKNLINETPKNQKHIIFWINKNLSYYCRELDFIIVFPKNISSQFEFIITANGNNDCFKHVINLIDNAPKLRTWKFSAFLELTEQINQSIDFQLKQYIIPEITLKIENQYSLALEQDKDLQSREIWIDLKNYILMCTTKTLNQVIYIITQRQITTESTAQNITFIQLAFPKAEQKDFIVLQEFQYYLDAL